MPLDSPAASQSFLTSRPSPTTDALAFGLPYTYSHMAMQSLSTLDRTFHALADGTRRSMIRVLARGEPRSAGDLGRRFQSAQPTISKHLKVLEEAGLVMRTVDGRVHRFALRRKPLRDAERWLARHQSFWSGAVAQLDRLLSETDDAS